MGHLFSVKMGTFTAYLVDVKIKTSFLWKSKNGTTSVQFFDQLSAIAKFLQSP